MNIALDLLAQHNRSIWVVVPAFNEAEIIASVLPALQNFGYQVVVVDDGSSDETAQRARAAGVHVCQHAVNLGQGAALQTGITYALKNAAAIVVTFDSDGQHDPADIEALVAPIAAGQAQVCLGSRFLPGARAENISTAKLLLLKLATFYTRLTCGANFSDTHNGIRAFSREAARKLQITQNRMAHASEILSYIARAGLKFQEVPVRIRYTEYSQRKGQKISNSLNIIWESIFGGLRR